MIEKIPPHSIECEESILSAAMLGGADQVCELLDADDFYRSAHGIIFTVICELVDSKIEVDLPSVVSKLSDKEKLSEVGGAAYVARLIDTIPSSLSIEHHAKIIKDNSRLRKMIQACSETVQRCFNRERIDDIMAKHDSEISKIVLHGGSLVKLGDVLPAMIDKWESLKNSDKLPGIPTGLADIDKKFGGLQGSTLYVVAARPGMGKSAWGMRVARGASQSGFPALQISLEMSKEQLCTREVSCVASVDGERFQNGDLDNSHWSNIVDACEQISDLPIYIDDSPRATIKECQSKIRQFRKKHGRCIVLIDYLDYISGVASDRKDLEIGTITKGLKASAKENDIPVVIFCQLNRKCEERDNKRPEVKDLRNSGEIEQDADVIAFIYRDEVYNPQTEHKGMAEFIVRKYRNGKPGTVFLTWIDHRTTFENYYYNKKGN